MVQTYLAKDIKDLARISNQFSLRFNTHDEQNKWVDEIKLEQNVIEQEYRLTTSVLKSDSAYSYSEMDQSSSSDVAQPVLEESQAGKDD